MSKSPPKEYGLILPSTSKTKASSSILKKPSIFASDSDSDEAAPRPTGISTGLKRQDKEIQDKAIEEDPTIYQYDELYDEMDQKRKDSKLSQKDLDKKPKYINNLLKAAEKRKLENERRIERQVQREREAEGNEFKDKEQFVTSAYKKKLEEMRQQEELEKREEYLEAIGDVTKQGNLDGFYRHLYEQKVNYDPDKQVHEIINTVKNDASGNSSHEGPDDQVKSEESGSSEDTRKENSSKSAGTKRQYRRKRSHSRSDESEEETTTIPSHLPSNLDADSDFSIDLASESEKDDAELTDEVAKEERTETEVKKGVIATKDKQKERHTGANGLQHVGTNGDVHCDVKDLKPKIDVWKKRTVGAVFDAALMRYHQREQLRRDEAGT